MLRYAQTAIFMLTALIPLGTAHAAGNPFLDTPLYPSVTKWVVFTDPFNEEHRLQGHIDESDGLTVSFQWYCPRSSDRFHLGIGVEGHKLDATSAGQRRLLWLRQRIDQREAEDGFIDIEDDYRFTVISTFGEFMSDNSDHVLSLGFSVSGRERVFQLKIDRQIKDFVGSGCPKTKEYDPVANAPLPAPEGVPLPRQMR